MHGGPRSSFGRSASLLGGVLAAAALGAATAALVVSIGARAKGTLSENGVSVDDGGNVVGIGNLPVLDAVLRDVFGRVRCDAPTEEQCVDPAYLQTDCGQTALRALRSTGTSACAGTCPTPTLADCKDEQFLATLCGQLEIEIGRVPPPASCTDRDASTTCPASPSTCRNLLFADASALQQQSGSVFASAPEGTVIVPNTVAPPADATPQELLALEANGYADLLDTRVVKKVAPDWSDFEVVAPASTYGGRVLEETAWERAFSPSAAQQALAVARAQELAAWDDNGNVVTSCAEYVHEKYYDYTAFERARIGPGKSARDAWEIAYGDGDGAIGTRGAAAEAAGEDLVLRQKDGTALPISLNFPQGEQPKNEFFSTPVITGSARDAVLADYDEQGGISYTFKLWGTQETTIVLPRPVFGLFGFSGIVLLDDDLNAAFELPASQREITENWTWHQQRGTQFGRDMDEQLAVYERLRAEFVPLLVRWANVAGEASSLIKAQLPRGDVLVNNVPFDPSIYESVVTDSSIAGVARLTSVRAAAAADRALVTGIAEPPSSGLSISLAGLQSLQGSAFASLVSPALTQQGTGPITPMSGSLGSSLTSLGSASLLLNPDLIDVLRPALQQQGSFLAQLQPLLEEMAILSGEIEAALLEAKAVECLEGEISPCDWSPQRFLQRVADQFESERDYDFRRCVQATQDEFGQRELDTNVSGRFLVTLSTANPTPRTAAWAPGDNMSTPCDDARYDTSPTRFERYMSCYARWKLDMLAALSDRLQGAEKLVNPETGEIQPNETTGDAVRAGDDLFAVGAEYGVEWRLQGLPPADSSNDTDRWCSLTPTLHGHAQVDGTIMGFDVELAEARVDVDTRPGQRANNRAYIEVGGEELIALESADGSIDISKYNLIFDETTTNLYELFSYSQTFPVGPVWLNVSAGAAGMFGAQVRGAVGRLGSASQGCAAGDLGLEGTLRPFVGFQAFASAGVDYLVVSAGVKITLTLVELSFPFRLALTFEGRPVGNGVIDTQMVLSNSLDVVLQILDGRLSAFVEVCFILCEEFEATLFEWEGPRWVWNLFATELELSLGEFVEFQTERVLPGG